MTASHLRSTALANKTLAAVLLWFLVGIILFPAYKTLEISLLESGHWSLGHYAELVTNRAMLATIWNSVQLGFYTVLLCGITGTALAFAINFFEFPFRKLVDKLLLLPMMLPGIIIVFSFMQLYGESGLITKSIELFLGLDKPPFRFSGLSGILFVHTNTQYVYFYIAVSVAIRHLDWSIIESARSLGATKVRVFFSIIIPSLAPALAASALITFMTGIGSFTAPSIIGGRYKVLTTQILLAKANNYMAVAATQVVVLTVISLVMFTLFRVYEARSQFTGSVSGVTFRSVRIGSRTLSLAMNCCAVFIIGSILLPVFAIVALSFVPSGSWMVNIYPNQFSFANYADIFTKTRKFEPFANSTVMALVAALFGLMLAVPASYLVVKTKLKLRWLIEFIVMLPWAMPASAVAINIINAFSGPTIFTFGNILVGTFILLPIGYLIRSISIMVKTVSISFQNLHDTYIEASYSLGASRLRSFRTVILPMLTPGLFAGFLLMFVRSIGEYTVSVFLYNASNKPVSIAMVNAIFEYNIGLAMAYGALLILLTTGLTILSTRVTNS